MKHKITYQMIEDFTDPFIEMYLLWWSEHTKVEIRMQYRTTEWFKVNLMLAIFAFNEKGEIVAAAGLFPCIDQNQNKIFHTDGRLTVELGSLFVFHEYGGKGIARRFVAERLEFSQARNYFPVMVTRDLVMTQRILNGSAEPIDNHFELKRISSKIRYCACREEKIGTQGFCEFCPKKDKTILIFLSFL